MCRGTFCRGGVDSRDTQLLCLTFDVVIEQSTTEPSADVNIGNMHIGATVPATCIVPPCHRASIPSRFRIAAGCRLLHCSDRAVVHPDANNNALHILYCD